MNQSCAPMVRKIVFTRPRPIGDLASQKEGPEVSITSPVAGRGPPRPISDFPCPWSVKGGNLVKVAESRKQGSTFDEAYSRLGARNWPARRGIVTCASGEWSEFPTAGHPGYRF